MTDRLKKTALYLALLLLGYVASVIVPDVLWLHEQHESAKTQAAAMALIQNAQKQQAPPVAATEPKKEK